MLDLFLNFHDMSSTETLRPANNQPVSLKGNPLPVELSDKTAAPAHSLTESSWAMSRTSQLNHSQIPAPEKVWVINLDSFKLLNFAVICFAEIGNNTQLRAPYAPPSTIFLIFPEIIIMLSLGFLPFSEPGVFFLLWLCQLLL